MGIGGGGGRGGRESQRGVEIQSKEQKQRAKIRETTEEGDTWENNGSDRGKVTTYQAGNSPTHRRNTRAAYRSNHPTTTTGISSSVGNTSPRLLQSRQKCRDRENHMKNNPHRFRDVGVLLAFALSFILLLPS